MGDLILGIIGFALTAVAAFAVFQWFRVIHLIGMTEMMDDRGWLEEKTDGD